MTNWYDSIVDDIKEAIESVYAKKTDITELEEEIGNIHTLIYGTGNE